MPAVAQPVPLPPGSALADCARFVDDVTVPDGTLVEPGQMLDKVWRFENCGTTAWDGYHAVQVSGSYGPATIDLPITPPGATADLRAPLRAPEISGVHRAVYQLAGPGGSFGPRFMVEVAIPDCSAQEARSGGFTVSRDALGEDWCPIAMPPSQGDLEYTTYEARYANLSSYSKPRQARFWVMVAPSPDRVLHPLMVMFDLAVGRPTGGPGSSAGTLAFGDGQALKLVRVTPDGASADVAYSFFIGTANVFVSVSGAASDELADLEDQAYGFATQQEQRLRDVAGSWSPD